MNMIGVISWSSAAATGAIIGSFLTVVAARVPPLVMADPDGRVGPRALLRALSWPGSHCTSCNAPLGWQENIPIISFMMLHGRCRACQSPYGHRYFLLECATAAAAIMCVASFGWSWQAAMAFLLLSVLLALSEMDFSQLLLPDILVLPLLPLGLLYQALFANGWIAATLGALAGYGILWTIAAIYRRSRGCEGMGGGDIKLAAALGAWLGIQAMPSFLLLAFATGLAGMGVPVLLRGKNPDLPVPFGPFLALSGACFVLAPQAVTWLSRFLAG